MLLHLCLSYTFMAVAQAATLNSLRYVTSSGGSLNATLTVDKYFYDSFSVTGAKFWTRVYNRSSISGDILHPGPVLKFKRGDIVTVLLENNLGPETTDLGSNSINSFHYANVTNLHTHGLHISAESPQDNVLMNVEPGGSYKYVYSIPDDHAGGTFWYHAHHHGSTTPQVGGGMLGAIIVEDDASEIPSVYLSLPEIVMIISHTPARELLNRFLSVTGDDLFSHDDNDVGNNVEFTLVNGQYQPTADMVQGKWSRLRLIFNSITTSLELQMTSNSIGCEWYLLAKDGIYVNEAPRTFGNTVYMGPGNRVDLVMRCASSGSVTLGTTATSNIIAIDVSGSSDSAEEDLPKFTPYRPDYLANLITSTTTTPFSLNIQGVSGSCTLNGNSWDGSTALGSMVAGSIQEWDIQGINRHPFHIHVNSYQLAGVTSTSNFFAAGDWHDVLYVPNGISVNKVFFAVDSFVTKSVLHCHFLHHEDKGCMGFIQHTGTEGATTGLSGNAMSCVGTSTGTATFTDTCNIVTPSPTSGPTKVPTLFPSSSPTLAPTLSPTSPPSFSTSYRLNFEQTLNGLTTESLLSVEDIFTMTVANTLNKSQSNVVMNNVNNQNVLKHVLSVSLVTSVMVDYSVLTSNTSEAVDFTQVLNVAVASGQLLSDLQSASAVFTDLTSLSNVSYTGSSDVYNSPSPTAASSAVPTETSSDENEVLDYLVVIIIAISLVCILAIGCCCYQRRKHRKVQQGNKAGLALRNMTPVGVPRTVH